MVSAVAAMRISPDAFVDGVALGVLCYWRRIMNIGDVCSREVYIVRKGEPLVDAAREMRRRHVGAVVVVEPATICFPSWRKRSMRLHG